MFFGKFMEALWDASGGKVKGAWNHLEPLGKIVELASDAFESDLGACLSGLSGIDLETSDSASESH